MKKLLNLLLLLLIFSACSDDENNTLTGIVLDKNTSTTQTIYSDETAAKEGISFTAADKWAATVNEMEVREAGRVEWLTLSQYEGGAGTFNLGITLAANYTGSDRKAEIKIASGETSVAIVVEQKAITRDEAENGPQTVKKVKKLNMFEQVDGRWPSDDEFYLSTEVVFSYDDQNRVSSFETTENWYNSVPDSPEGSSEGEWVKDTEKNTFTYSKQDNGNMKIEASSLYSEEGTEYKDIEILYCDNTGKVITAESKEVIEGEEQTDEILKYQLEYNSDDQLIKTISQMGKEQYSNEYTWSDNNYVSYTTTMPYSDYGDITYTDIKNNANLDLALLASFSSTSSEVLGFPYGVETGSVIDHFGKRVANLPATVNEKTPEGVKTNAYTFEYKRDADGNVNEVMMHRTRYQANGEIEYTSKYKVTIEYMD